ncbi:hypothetical protein ABZ851_16310 [Streptomyces sp. NPDC047049]|uniref:hypothetical protein n=1 Tax=Streptomyces sp. NPDC047049 TaxID=3156688 RepID=UPI00340EAF43
MSERTQRFRPGESVPESGIYECDCGKAHRWSTSTNVKDHTFPPLPEDCSGGAWIMKDPAHPAS